MLFEYLHLVSIFRRIDEQMVGKKKCASTSTCWTTALIVYYKYLLQSISSMTIAWKKLFYPWFMIPVTNESFFSSFANFLLSKSLYTCTQTNRMCGLWGVKFAQKVCWKFKNGSHHRQSKNRNQIHEDFLCFAIAFKVNSAPWHKLPHRWFHVKTYPVHPYHHAVHETRNEIFST